jgi:hypothetical protein
MSNRPADRPLKQVRTPDGVFSSARAAAEKYGMSYEGARWRAKRQRFGWHYLEDPPPIVGEAKYHVIERLKGRKAAQRDAYENKLSAAKKGKIEFCLTLEEFQSLFKTEEQWLNYGLKKGGYMLCRKIEPGPYSIDNVYLGTPSDNNRDAFRNGGKTYRRIRTPKGDFDSLHEAAEAYKITSGAASNRANKNCKGFSYIDPKPKPKQVKTPADTFESTRAAADYYNITDDAAYNRAKYNRMGWSFVEEEAD